MLFRTAYDDHVRFSISFPDKGLTKQSFKDECDVNLILSKYQRTGVLDFVNKHEPRFGDAVAPDFQSCLDVVIQGQRMFDDIPSSIRKRFGNDPSEFMAFISNPDNRDEAVKMGLVTVKDGSGGGTPGVVPSSAPEPVSAPVGSAPKA